MGSQPIMSMSGLPRPTGRPLQQRHRALAAVGADRDDRKESGGSDVISFAAWLRILRAGRGEGMAERQRAAVRIDAAPVERAEIGGDVRLLVAIDRVGGRLDVAEHLGGESLVDLEERDLRETKPVAREQARDRAPGRHQDALALLAEIHGGHLPVDELGDRRHAEALDALASPTHTAAAPSVTGDELPAVSVPFPLLRSNASGSAARLSAEVSRRGIAS